MCVMLGISDLSLVELLNARQLDDLHGLFFIAAREDRISWRTLCEIFRAIGHEIAEPKAESGDFR
jgi:hypothetical protein